MQEREKRGDTWSPRFFKHTPEKETFSNEFSDEQCPLWEFNGEYMKLDPRPAMPEGTHFTVLCHAWLAETKRKDYAFWRQSNEKSSMIQGCPGRLDSMTGKILV